MLIHQSLVDGAACLFATLLLIQPSNWVPGVLVLDHVICHVWNGQMIYWDAVFISGQCNKLTFVDIHRRIRISRSETFH